MDNAYLLIGLSVIMHVAWNLLARHVDSKANYLWWGLLAHCLILGPYSLWQLYENASWHQSLIFAIVITAIANSLYFVSLRRAYHFAPVSLVYPLARSSPLLIAIWSSLFFGANISSLELMAILISVAGLWVVACSSGIGNSKKALPWTLAAAICTSIYSLSDKVAVTYLPGFAEQLGFITIGYACSFFVLSVLQKQSTGSWIPPQRPPFKYIVVGGCFIGTAYALVVRAMNDLPAAHVVSFTNAGIILAVLLSVFVFREREQWKQRIIGALVVSFGLLLLFSNSS